MVGTEREDVLVICSNNQNKKNREIFEEIIKWKIPGAQYILIPEISKDFQDIYIDTREKYFQKMKIALRIRKNHNNNIITVKIPTNEHVETGRNDTEIEKIWSKDGLIEIFESILYHIRNDRGDGELDLPFKKVHQISERVVSDNLHITDDIIDSIRKLDLEVVQDRYTHREIRNILLKDGKPHEILAELAMDSVVFNFNDIKIRHYDIEVEEKASNGASARESIIWAFTSSMYSPFLMKWKYGKLVLGKAIGRLIIDRYLPKEEYDNLSIRTYNKIQEMIQNSQI